MPQLLAFLMALTIIAQPALGSEKREIELSSGTSMVVNQFEGDSDSLIIWIPSERGLRGGYLPVALDMEAMGQSLWSVDLHSSYMEPQGRRSFEAFEHEDLSLLLKEAGKQGFKKVYFFSSGRGARFSLEVGRAWQESGNKSPQLGGYLFVHPHLIEGRTEMGETADYVPISHMTNLPVYLIQPQFSPKYARVQEVANILQNGGSNVFVQTLKGVVGGYYARPEKDLSEIDLAAKAAMADTLLNAVSLLSQTELPTVAANAYKPEDKTESSPTSSFREALLHPYIGDTKPPALKLPDRSGKIFDLSEIKDEVVLLNFWATWCGPCVEEIPSLARLQERLKGKSFRIISINIGETPERIAEFGKKIPIEFPVLLDEHSDTVRDWKVYAYPSNFLVGKDGLISHAYRGALEWDADSVVSVIEQELAK